MTRLVSLCALLLASLSAPAWSAQPPPKPVARSSPKAPPKPEPEPAPSPLERTFVQASEADEIWRTGCPVGEELAVGESKSLDLGLVKIVSDEVPIARYRLEPTGKVRVTGLAAGLTILAGLKRSGRRVARCIKVLPAAHPGEDPNEQASPEPCAMPATTRAQLVQSVEIEPGARLELPAEKWRRFTVDDPGVVKVAGVGPDALSLEAKAVGKTQLRVCKAHEFLLIRMEVRARQDPRPVQ